MEPLTPHPWTHDRRRFLGRGLASIGWMTALGHVLARADEAERPRQPARSVIVLWMAGGPSQLETFDPHPGTATGGDTGAIDTAVRGIRLAEGFDRLAEEMASVSLIRSMMTREGDHERGSYLLKTGYRPDPTVVHPSIGAVCCHELPQAGAEIPRHISILPGQWPGQGGYFGDDFDAFKMFDPINPVPDVTSRVNDERDRQRLDDLDALERDFARGRTVRAQATLHRATVERARAMMTSAQLRAFDVNQEPAELRASYGNTPFGRGCLAARRLIDVGARCVEVTLDGWDTHTNNRTGQRSRVDILDPAFAALIRDLRQRDLLRSTVVLCAGEFGRTPRINRLEGRDHWTNGFSVALAGGGLRGGVAHGETDPEGTRPPTSPIGAGDVHATILQALGIDYRKIMSTPIGRTVRLSEGEPIRALTG